MLKPRPQGRGSGGARSPFRRSIDARPRPRLWGGSRQSSGRPIVVPVTEGPGLIEVGLGGGMRDTRKRPTVSCSVEEPTHKRLEE